MKGLLSLVILILDILAIIEVLKSSKDTGNKIPYSFEIIC